MRIVETDLPGVVIIEPKIFKDSRGHFLETWREEVYRQAGVTGQFVQDNISYSTRGVLRGLHYQHPHAQGKLVTVISGEVFDVAVDIRVGSPSFGRWLGVVLSSENHRQLWIPPGYAHGFCVVSDSAYFAYKCTDVYTPEAEGGIRWNDPAIGISWPTKDVILSDKDGQYPLLKDIPPIRLPVY